jgi:solute carrier family 35 protein E3
VATVNDVQLNFLGTVCSLGAIVTTCMAQIWTGTMQRQYGLSSTQLLHACAPVMGFTLLVIGLPLDGALQGERASLFVLSTPVVCWALLSCAIAISVNFSTFMVIGKCDAVTYQVLGHLKTMLVLVLGFVVLKNPANTRVLAGLLVALIGMVAYAHEESKAAAAAAAAGAAGAVVEKEKAATAPERGLPSSLEAKA